MARRLPAIAVITATAVVAFGVAVWMTGRPSPAAAQASLTGVPPCSAASLQGTYGLLFQGFVAGAPFHGMGVVQFDGAGKASGHFDEMFNGVLDPSTFAGDYAVEPDCTGFVQMTAHQHEKLPAHLHRAGIVVVDGGREGLLLLVDTQPPGEPPPGAPEPSFTVSGTFKRM